MSKLEWFLLVALVAFFGYVGYAMYRAGIDNRRCQELGYDRVVQYIDLSAVCERSERMPLPEPPK